MNATRKYPQKVVDGTTFPVKWMSTNAVHYVTCPRCGAEPGYYCVTPAGARGRQLTGGAHGERMQALQEQQPAIAGLSRITI